MGKHQLKLLQFAIEYPRWHSYATDALTTRTVDSLESLKLIEVDRETRSFRLALQGFYREAVDSVGKPLGNVRIAHSVIDR